MGTTIAGIVGAVVAAILAYIGNKRRRRREGRVLYEAEGKDNALAAERHRARSAERGRRPRLRIAKGAPRVRLGTPDAEK